MRSLNNMGTFSWITRDSFRSIPNVFCDYDCFTVYMHSPDGRKWKDTEYMGYGVFGGKDYYKVMAEINGLYDREDAIELYYHGWKSWRGVIKARKNLTQEQKDKLLEKNKTKTSEDTLYPALLESSDPPKSFKVKNEECPHQGDLYYWQEGEGDEEEW